MPSIVTLTVNPTIDKGTRVERVKPSSKLRCEEPTREPGGGGLNVSRVIQEMGGKSRALYLSGGATGEILEDLLDGEELDHYPLPIQGWTRESLHVTEASSGDQFRFGMPGPTVKESEWRALLDILRDLDPRPGILVASGSLAPGMPDDFLGRVSEVAAQVGARLVVDTSGPPLQGAVAAGAYLVKPNIREFQELVGRDLPDEEAQIDAGLELIDEGRVEAVALSLGRGGALLITAEGGEHIRTPTVPIRSKVGAGDSMVAGIVLGLAREWELGRAVRFGVACGAAAVMTDGSELARRVDAERLFHGMKEGASGS
ncbi:MAG: 1-phosphofructokinase family hexose kinase [Gemmatimonadales bacterium]|nr:MAG: 1-phosphofructokinase family hexose kinase [Gemmatimonadales bacterium]